MPNYNIVHVQSSFYSVRYDFFCWVKNIFSGSPVVQKKKLRKNPVLRIPTRTTYTFIQKFLCLYMHTILLFSYSLIPFLLPLFTKKIIARIVDAIKENWKQFKMKMRFNILLLAYLSVSIGVKTSCSVLCSLNFLSDRDGKFCVCILKLKLKMQGLPLVIWERKFLLKITPLTVVVAL